ncbi:MAG TPA: reverse transcriptase family protein [Thermoanaerobaculia bacterium]|jgi:retron-type reverse transcriptase|nr:reverse transcriptase family protein [Thermoanaerobaculia bacterium]
METADRHLAIHNLNLLQRQAGVERTVRELVVAYGRLCVDAEQPLVFDPRPFAPGSRAEERLRELRDLNPRTSDAFLAFLAAYSAAMADRGFLPLVDSRDLADRLGYRLGELEKLAERTSSLYRQVDLRRPGGGVRRIHSPRQPLRGIQRWILRHVLAAYEPHEAAHGFVRGRSIVSNASPHAGKPMVVTMDIAGFFPGISHRALRRGLERLGYPYSVARLLANLCTRRGYLPQGAPTSPALSNLVCERLDRRLAGLARSRGFTYTRYADDMAFSSTDRRLPTLIPFLRQIVEEEGFAVHPDKTRVLRPGGRRTVTGVVVNENPNLPRAHVRTLRAAAHRLARRGAEAVAVKSRRAGADPKQVLAGHLGFLAMINPDRHRALAASAARASASPAIEPA